MVYLAISFSYLVWRALRSLNPGWWYFYSVPFFMIELTGWTLGLCFIYSLYVILTSAAVRSSSARRPLARPESHSHAPSLVRSFSRYYQIDRPSRSITVMLPEDEFPKVDVYICRYSEPVEILEATTVAALNMDYPGDKLSIYVCDDGKSPEVLAMCKRLRYQLRYMDRRANLFYVGRSKKEGVPHHAKAGNINNTLLMHSSEDVQYLMVLDCDMIVHPTFLHRTLSHFYVSDDNGGWRQKEFIGLLQTPQDFWNVDSEDPMVHCARFFYGPMLQGRDGCGACPCCGTGVIFQRSTLVSVGGQSYGSITEDCNTSMQLLSSGFANMFLNERLVYGMAPEDLPGVFQQRARWAMGAIQILYRDNPLRKRGLTMSQSFLFFEIGAHHYLAIGTAMATLVPLIYVYVEASPVIVEYLWEFCIVFGVFFATNRVMIWWAHRGCASGGTLELWRGGQMWIWMCPSHIKSIWKTFMSETNLFGWLGSFELTFKVTSKDEDSVSFCESLAFASPFVLYILAVIGSTIYFVVMAVVKNYSTWVILMTLTALAWSVYISLCIWPPVSVMIPRVETDHGWKISWETAIDESKLMVDEKNRIVRRPRGKKRWSMRKGSIRADGNGNGSQNAGIRRHDSLVGKVVKEMEEGAVPYDFAGLTKDAINTYRLGVTLDDHDVEGAGSCSDDDIYTSPFAADGIRDVLSHPLNGGDSERAQSHPSPEARKPAGVRHRLVQFGSSIVEGMSTILPSMSSQSLSQKASSMNIGRVALPAKTARGIAGSMYTSMILPEPSKVHFDASRALSARAMSSATADAYHGRSVSWATPSGGDGRRDIRAVRVQSMVSQDEIRRSLILMEAAGPSKSALVARQLVRAHSQQLAQNKKKGAAEQQNLADRAMTGSFVETLHRNVVLSEVSEPRVGVKASHTDVVPSGDNARLEPSDADFASPLVDETSMPQAIAAETTNETTERDPSFASPFLAADSPASDTTKGLGSPADVLGSSATTAPLPGGAAGGHRNRQKFTLTKDGRVFASGQELALDALLENVFNEMKFSAGPVGSMGLTSPMLDPQYPGYFPDIQGDAGPRSGAMSMRMGTSTATSASKVEPSGTWSLPLSSYGSQAPLSPGHTAELASYGRSILHSMRSMSYRQNLPPDSQKVVDMQRRMIPPAVIMGESAMSMLGNRLMNQPGSIVMSSLFAQLSQMQPSQLETRGYVFDSTAAGVRSRAPTLLLSLLCASPARPFVRSPVWCCR